MNPSSVQRVRPTIALLVDGLIEDYEVKVWSGVSEAARKRDANLLCFACGTLNSPHLFSSQRNILLDLLEQAVEAGHIDGAIALTGALANFSTAEEVLATYARFSKVPLISIGMRFDGIPSITIDNVGGMYDMISHLIRHHGRRRVAFIRGPEYSQDAQERFETYKKVLRDCSLPFDPGLVAPGDFLIPSGKHAVELLMDGRKLKFDAIVGANDGMALDAMKALLARGVKIPEEVSVAGFDDAREARSAIPGLSSVQQPGKELGMRAAGLLLDLLQGKKVPEQNVLHARPVLRESCGCSGLRAGDRLPAGNRTAAASALPETLAVLAGECIRDFSIIGDMLETEHWLDDLLGALRIDLESDNPASTFLPLLKSLAAKGAERGLDISTWTGLLDLLFKRLAAHIRPENPLPHLAFSAMKQLAESIEVQRRMQYEEQTLLLYRAYQRLSASLDMETLRGIMDDVMPRLQIGNFYISTYPGRQPDLKGNMRPVIGFENGKNALGGNPPDFPSARILPGGLNREERFSFAVYALFLEHEQIGYAVYDTSRNGNNSVYEVLTSQLSNVLKSAALFDEVRNYAKNLEAEVQQRTADLRKKTEEVERLNAELTLKNRFDSLTALYNRGAFFEFVRGEVNRMRRMHQKMRQSGSFDPSFCIMMLDIDHFKNINDTYGHLVGDRVLRQVGELLTREEILRKEDIAGRFGGEEFIVVLTNSTLPNALPPAKRLAERLARMDFEAENGHRFKVTVSIGISQYYPEDQNEEAVINRADKALYHAKETGRNRIVVYEEEFPIKE